MAKALRERGNFSQLSRSLRRHVSQSLFIRFGRRFLSLFPPTVISNRSESSCLPVLTTILRWISFPGKSITLLRNLFLPSVTLNENLNYTTSYWDSQTQERTEFGSQITCNSPYSAERRIFWICRYIWAYVFNTSRTRQVFRNLIIFNPRDKISFYHSGHELP